MANSVKVVSFDCAQTLVEVNWVPHEMALQCADLAGLTLDRQVAGEVYARLIGSRWGDYMALHQTKDPAVLEQFWTDITHDWLARLGVDVAWVPQVLAQADEVLYGPNSTIYRLYDDVIPTLSGLKEKGLPMIVISNWDTTLHRVLAHFGLTEFFQFVLASMEEGAEKPDPRLFQVALDRLGLPPEAILHVGDNPIDDVRGASAMGMQAILIDRGSEAGPARIPDLRHLLELF